MIITSLTPIHPHLPYSPLLTPVQYCSLGQTDPFSLSLSHQLINAPIAHPTFHLDLQIVVAQIFFNFFVLSFSLSLLYFLPLIYIIYILQQSLYTLLYTVLALSLSFRVFLPTNLSRVVRQLLVKLGLRMTLKVNDTPTYIFKALCGVVPHWPQNACILLFISFYLFISD